jgi:hypothetical protein
MNEKMHHPEGSAQSMGSAWVGWEYGNANELSIEYSRRKRSINKRKRPFTNGAQLQRSRV